MQTYSRTFKIYIYIYAFADTFVQSNLQKIYFVYLK